MNTLMAFDAIDLNIADNSHLFSLVTGIAIAAVLIGTLKLAGKLLKGRKDRKLPRPDSDYETVDATKLAVDGSKVPTFANLDYGLDDKGNRFIVVGDSRYYLDIDPKKLAGRTFGRPKENWNARFTKLSRGKILIEVMDEAKGAPGRYMTLLFWDNDATRVKNDAVERVIYGRPVGKEWICASDEVEDPLPKPFKVRIDESGTVEGELAGLAVVKKKDYEKLVKLLG